VAATAHRRLHRRLRWESRLSDLHVSVAAVLAAHSLNVGYGPIISPGVPALTRDRLSMSTGKCGQLSGRSR
jgi:hypothetical protein